MSVFSRWPLPLKFLDQNTIWLSYLPCMRSLSISSFLVWLSY
jgi:hypothetical protein